MFRKETLERELDDVTARIEELQKTILRKDDQIGSRKKILINLER